MDPQELQRWLAERIEANAPESCPTPDRFRYQDAVIQLVELRRVALTGTGLRGMQSIQPMSVADPVPLVARIDVLLDGWRAIFVDASGEDAGTWVDLKRGLVSRPPEPTLIGDPAGADARLLPTERDALEEFARWIRDPRQVAASAPRDPRAPPYTWEVNIGHPDPAGLRALARLFERRFETMFPPIWLRCLAASTASRSTPTTTMT